MIPRSYPTLMDGRKAGYMQVFYLTSVTGLTKWIDYIPVKTVAFSATAEGTTNANGHINVTQVESSTARSKWVDYIPVFEDGAATVAWSTNANGYIPVNQMLSMDFRSGILDSRITFTRADAVTCATYFDSTGRMQTAAANVARFDYDPATPAGVTGGELVTSSWTLAGSASNSAGTLTFTGNGDGANQYGFATTGKTYRITFNVVSTNGNGSFGVYSYQGANATYSVISVASVGVKTAYVVGYPGGGVQFASGGFAGVINGVSVQEVTFTPRGLLIEESRANLLLWSRDMTNAAWSKTDTTPTQNQVGLDGTANSATLLTEGSAGTAITQQSGAAVTAGSTITASVVLKRGNTDWVRVTVRDSTGADGGSFWFNLNTGAKGAAANAGAGTASSSTITSLGGGWYRCAATTVPNGTYTQAIVSVLSASADGNGTRVSGATYIVGHAQLEVGAFATSPILTTSASLTRAADSASMTGSNFSSWFNATQGTFVAEFLYNGPSATQGGVFSASDGTVSNRISSRMSGTGSLANISVVTASSAVVDGFPSTVIGTTAKVAAAYAASSFAVTANAAAPTTASSGAVPSGVNQLQLGNYSGPGYLNGWIRRLTYYPVRLGNSQLQSLTT